ncbi:MFS transporter [Neoroseomonas oryzicola]|uniref:OFA family MFS transporter n=1 Tax=Neoroseomonas oryzicola TaxID=535904 RepID=A0A9X9WCU6_9PROT|nr:OFA family MFS transporter [Neoroseomonas oryzicola]NKE16027.1 OFA family MFS transporter [Neoroseomonas oryzicola]
MRAADRPRHPRRRSRRLRRHPGWRVVAGAFLLVLTGFGAIYSYAAFAEQIAADFATDEVGVSVIYALSGASCFFVSAVSGPLADRLGPRLPATVGMALVGLGLLVAAAAGSLVEIYAGYGLLIGVGTGFAYVPAMAAVQRCFTAHRGLASGIAASGIGVGTALVPPAAQAFLAVVDWRATFAIFGVAAVLAGAVGAMLLEPAGRRGTRRGATARAAAELPVALRSPAFARAWIGTLLVSMPATLPQAMLAGTAREFGLPREEALGLLGLIGLGTIAGRFLIAAVSDVLGRRRTFIACCAGMAGSLCLWAGAGGAEGLQAFALVFGALQGGFVALLPAFGADSFGVRAAGGVLGMLYTSRGVALLLAPPALAAAALATGHAAPVLLAAGLGVLGTVLLARTPHHAPAARPRNAEGPGGRPPEPSHRVAGARPAEPW